MTLTGAGCATASCGDGGATLALDGSGQGTNNDSGPANFIHVPAFMVVLDVDRVLEMAPKIAQLPGWTLIQNSTNYGLAEYQIVSSTGSGDGDKLQRSAL